MIKRHYFMAYQTGTVNGVNAIGSMTGTSTTWLPNPVGLYGSMVKAARARMGGQEVTVTSFQRIR